MDLLNATLKEKERERDKEKEKEREKDKDKERERETDLEAALYTNCLLLGLDPAVLGQGAGNRAGLFRHSNPRVGEALLHFLLCSLRGPTLSAKDFAGVWPIFDAAQSRDFRKIVQGLINDLEAQGALPRSNSRVSSLATCCGHRFVELLWQLSAHALREVHRRNFPSDVAANPLPAPLTEVVSQNSHAAALIPITKARIALERRKFLEGAAAAVRRQSLWSNLGNELTAEYRALCAEEAFLNKELEKLQEHEGLKRTSNGVANGGPAGAVERQFLVEKASESWDSLLAHTALHDKLASGPIEDLIAHREHRYRIDGVLLRSAVDRGRSVDDESSRVQDDDLPISSHESGLEETRRSDERYSKGSPALDVAEILRRWTHALQRVHKQALRLARLNDGAGPELLKDPSGTGDIVHAHAVQATLVEHRQHLANMQVLMSQLKEAMPGMEGAIADLRQQVNSPHVVAASSIAQAVLSASAPCKDDGHLQQAGAPNLATITQLDLAPPSLASKLPLSTGPFLERTRSQQRRLSTLSQLQSLDVLQEIEAPVVAFGNEDRRDSSDETITALKQSVRAAALSRLARVPDASLEESATSSEHYFTPITSLEMVSGEDAGFQAETDVNVSSPEQPAQCMGSQVHASKVLGEFSGAKRTDVSPEKQWHNNRDASQCVEENLLEDDDDDGGTWSEFRPPDPEDIGRPSSPPLLMELSAFGDSYDDLLAPMSDFDTEMMH